MLLVSRIYIVWCQKRGIGCFAVHQQGADKYVEVSLYDDVVSPISTLKQDGYQIVAAHLTEQAVDYREVDFTKPTALLMGTELDGVSGTASEIVDHNIVVPMMGMVESFNVSVARAIILSEAHRQRQNASMYDDARLANDKRDFLFFKWAYPKLAKFCESHSLPFPPLDENGDLIPGTAPTLPE